MSLQHKSKKKKVKSSDEVASAVVRPSFPVAVRERERIGDDGHTGRELKVVEVDGPSTRQRTRKKKWTNLNTTEDQC